MMRRVSLLLCVIVIHTGTGDLVDVLEVVDSVIDWKRLGLTLGLLHHTLTVIESRRRGEPSECMIDMLSAWLMEQDYVSQTGVPSWSVLRAALEKIGENETADRIPTAAVGDSDRTLSELQ